MTSRTFRLPLLASVLFCLIPSMPARTAEDAHTRYLRSVYVLRTLNSSPPAGSVTIPRRIITDDATNALLQHPDKVFVLNMLARDLEALSRKKSQADAAYYAAHAYYTLGRKADAARVMDSYLLIAAYRPENYLFLLRCLYENDAYEAVRKAAKQWQAQDPRCDEKRLIYVWGSFRAEDRTAEAFDALQGDACKGWQPKVLAAKSIVDTGDTEGAERTVKSLMQRYPQHAKAISALWDQLRGAERYP